ncbi:hypothetical protein HNV08_01385 [Winogradskyella eckloniae]|uniref:hypothetical protein n=1 Tax=Winogradskyella eckloniae TaxID=1089306 RepID=UPI00156306CC|nr:hypothetical protein [Winogradskyella eckloniae]NRD18683.1 hypothetical protein [Winogradskyella eckloniae]
METLKLKIFEVLVNDISIEEFETWLYHSEEIISKIKTNTFIYQIITINYKSEKWRIQLEELTFSKFDKDELIVLIIEKECNRIIHTENYDKIYTSLSKIMMHFDYESETKTMWNFFSLWDQFDLIKLQHYSESTYYSDVKQLALETYSLLKTCQNMNQKKAILKSGKTVSKTIQNVEINEPKSKKKALSKKLFAFFKKS